ncbi:MAG: hypothetical protein PUG48_11025 [Clostridia bacterium]|nr:hypothetical protein [Clostridia bacterium]
MKNCIKNGNILAFSLGLLVSFIFPQCWLIVIVAVLLIIMAIMWPKCCRL